MRQINPVPQTDFTDRYHNRKWNESLRNYETRISSMCGCRHPRSEHVPIFGCIADADQFDVSCSCRRYRKAK